MRPKNIILHIVGIFLLWSYFSTAQTGCPRIDLGNDTVVDCPDDMLLLTADVLETGSTSNYTVSAIPANPPFPAGGGTPLFVGSDDVWSPLINLPFNFCFYEQSYDRSTVGANGVVSFHAPYAGGFCDYAFSDPIPSANLFAKTIFGVYHDIDPSVCGNINYAVVGNYPCRIFLINFSNVCHFSCNNLESTTQIVIYETTNVIDVYVENKPTCLTWNTGNAALGIQENGARGIAAPGRNTGPWSANNEAYRFTPNGPANYSIEWQDDNRNFLANGKTFNATLDFGINKFYSKITYTNCDGSVIELEDSITVTRPLPKPITLSQSATEICKGESVDLQVRGANSYTWTPAPDISNTADSNQTVSPANTTTYQLTANAGGCIVDTTFTVIVNPKPVLSGNNESICAGDTATLTVNGADAYSWVSNPSIISTSGNQAQVRPGNTSAYTVYGQTVEGCRDTLTLVVEVLEQPLAQAGSNQSVCDLSTGLNASFSLTGSNGFWSGPSGTVFSNPSNPNSQVSVPTYGSYTFYWAESKLGCSSVDSVRINFLETPDPFAGNTDSVCGTQYVLQANNAGFPGQWTSTNANVTFSNNTDPKATATLPPHTGPIDFIWTEQNSICSEDDTVTIQFYNLPAANAGNNQSTCGLSGQLDAKTNIGSCSWSATDLQGNPVIVNYIPNNSVPNPTVTVNAADTVIFTWTMDQGVCNSSDAMRFTFIEIPVSDAGLNDSTCANSYTLNANPSVGQGNWTILSGSAQILNPSSPQAQLSNASGTVRAVWEENNGACTDSDTVSITFISIPPYNAGVDQQSCSGVFNLSASSPGPGGSGTWTVFNPSGNQITGNFSNGVNAENNVLDLSSMPYGCYKLYWTLDYNFCEVTDSLELCYYEQPLAQAGNNDSVCGLNYSLNAVYSVSGSTGQWQALSTGLTINNPANRNSNVTSNGYGLKGLIWTEDNVACADKDTVWINFLEAPIAQAGNNQTVCDTLTQLNASPSVGTGSWFSNNPNISFSNPQDQASTVSINAGAYGTYEVVWYESNEMCSDADTVTINFLEQPVAQAGNNDTVCGLNYQVQAQLTSGHGFWENHPNLSFQNSNNPSTQVSSTAYGPQQLIWVEENGVCTDQDTIEIWFVEQPSANAGSDDFICGESYQLQALSSVGNGQWTSPDGLQFTQPTSANTLVDASNVGYGSFDVIWTEENMGCISSDTVRIDFYEQPIANAGVGDSICDTILNVAANWNLVGSGIWTVIEGDAQILNPNSPTSQIKPISYGKTSLVWSVSNGPCLDADTVTYYLFEPPFPNAGNDDEICGYTYELNASLPLGNGFWTGPAGANFTNPSDPNSLVDISLIGLGEYEFYWTDNNTICERTDTVKVNFIDVPEVVCECKNDTILSTDPYVTFLDESPRAIAWNWNFGDGNSSNAPNPTHLYTSSGVFPVTLTITDKYGCTNFKQMKITVEEYIRFFIPNAFTPNNDNLNETFSPTLLGHVPGSYEMRIYDRWGQLVYFTNDLNSPWTGETFDGTVKEDVYIVKVKYLRFNGQEENYVGRVSLFF